jgi:large conductance mechanosensitive channel
MAPHVSGGAVLHEAGSEVGDFKKFLLRGNVVDLAVGVVIGAAFGNVVQAIVKDILDPLIGAVGGTTDVSSLSVTVGAINFPIGELLQAVISLMLIALVVYFVLVLPVNKLVDRHKPQTPPAPTKECPECASKIPQPSRRCPQCTAQLLPPSDQVAAAMRQVATPPGAGTADNQPQPQALMKRSSSAAVSSAR